MTLDVKLDRSAIEGDLVNPAPSSPIRPTAFTAAWYLSR